MNEVKITREYVPFDEAVPKANQNLVEVVRCKDCVHQYYDLKDGRIVCGNVDGGEIHPAAWFCADGERRTDE